MLKFYYESGNDEVAVSQRNIKSKVEEYIERYKYSNENDFLISQVDMINTVGELIYQGEINYDEVSIIVPEFNKQLLFDEDGCLTEWWYGIVGDIDY